MSVGLLTAATVSLMVLGALAWRRASQRKNLPCPPWLGILLENPIRHLLYGPGATIARLGLQPGQRVLEVGPGTGVMSVPVARHLGPRGQLVCLDIQPRMVAALNRRLQAAGIRNASAIVGDACSLPFAAEEFDAAFFVTVLGEIPDRQRAVAEAARVLKPGGILAFTEIILDPHYQSRSTLRRLCQEAGLVEVATSGNWFVFTMRFVKAGPASS